MLNYDTFYQFQVAKQRKYIEYHKKRNYVKKIIFFRSEECNDFKFCVYETKS